MASSSTSPDEYRAWLDLNDIDLTPANVRDHLGNLPDDLWVAAACHDRVVDDIDVQQALLDIGLERTASAFQRFKSAISSSEGDIIENTAGVERSDDARVAYFRDLPVDARWCRLHSLLLGRLERLHTYKEMCNEMPEQELEDGNETDEGWDDDPWGEESSNQPKQVKRATLPIPLPVFLITSLPQSACGLALQELYAPLRVVLNRHGADLWDARFHIYESFPTQANPLDYAEFLPSIDADTDKELVSAWSDVKPAMDSHLAVAFEAATKALDIVEDSPSTTHLGPLTPEQLSEWYISRVQAVLETTGILDYALGVVQHGASQGVPGLDILGEDLTLLTRLVYDAPGGDDDMEEWTLERWNSMDPTTVVAAYTAHSTPESLPHDLIYLVMPYLYVVEARAERSGHPNPSLHNELLYDFILKAPLQSVAAIFEASKPTLPSSQRVIKNDEDMARLALACLYGSSSLNEWPTMSRIYECLPSWDASKLADYNADLADTTIDSLGDFVTPSISRPSASPSDLMVFFNPLPLSALSHALDILDVHLEGGEILARWDVPAPFAWFLQSKNDIKAQRARANQMARRSGASDDDMDGIEGWEWLLEDMIKLAGSGGPELRGAFGLISAEEIVQIFFSGLLSVGRFDLAKTMLRDNRHLAGLRRESVEELCLSCSREFYDNAASGNYKVGDMKLAYECLDVTFPTDRIVREKEFIEATSKLSSFNVQSHPGQPITPIEIRLTKDKLSLVSHLLASNSDAYNLVELVLELVRMLGYRGDVVAEVKALAMIADAALQAGDFDKAYQTSERMVAAVQALRENHDEGALAACEVCWVACFQLARHPEYEATEQKLQLFGHALELCPAEKLHDVLNAWTKLETQDIEERSVRMEERAKSGKVIPRKRSARAPAGGEGLRAQLANFQMHLPGTPMLLSTPDAAALASKTFKSVAANFSFGSRGRESASSVDGGSERSRSRIAGDDVAAQANRVFSKGIGWLIGADEE